MLVASVPLIFLINRQARCFQRAPYSVFIAPSFKQSVLPQDSKARRLFVTTGGLKKVQMIDVKPGSAVYEYVTVINACFPEEIVRYYSPGYPETLLDKVEQYSPQMMSVLRETDTNENEMQTDMLNVDEVTSDDDDERNLPPQ